jgi:hypothetical protein
MRTTMMTLLIAASSLGACKWTEFDDLSDSAWVVATERPDVGSSDYGVAIQRGDLANPSGGTLAVIGAGATGYSELAFSAQGKSSVPSNSFALSEKGVVSFDPQPPFLLANPSSSEVALITNGDAGSIVVAAGEHLLNVKQIFVTTVPNVTGIPATPSAATYMQPPKKLPGDPTPPYQPLVAAGDWALGQLADAVKMTPQAGCKLVDGATGIGVRALGTVRNTTTMADDVLAWGGNGKLYKYPGSVFYGCATPLSAVGVDTGFAPGVGSQILAVDATRAILQGHQGDASILRMVNTTTLMPIGNAVSAKAVRSAAILDVDGNKFVVAGYPTEPIDGITTGVVNIYKITAAGLDTTPAATLHDAQPENNQSFGRSVAVMPFNGKQVIAVAANNEIFVYFQAKLSDGTTLYDETRQGR